MTMTLEDSTPQLISEMAKIQHSTPISRPLISYDKRCELLKKLSEAIVIHTEAIIRALHQDLGKSNFESQVAEISFVQNEIKHTLKHLKKWIKPKSVSTPWALMPARSQIISEPKGRVLIIAPWNYPFQLLLSPLVGAIAAGNQVTLKPSELAPATASVITRMIQENFDAKIICVVNGGVEQTSTLLEQKFDHIFYTGNGHVARIIMEKASKHLTPVTLELGGKSPCVIAGDVDMEVTAKRLAWGKWFNAGQTCVAPDYVLIERRLKDQFLKSLDQTLREFYGNNAKGSEDYGRIVNQRHFNRLKSLYSDSSVIIGGEADESENYIAPTVVRASFDDPVMQDEIFGPILPVIEVDSFDEAVNIITRRDHPLAAYLFTNDNELQTRFLSEVQAGGICLNECLMHLSNPNLPFGGIGPSGMGAYHGHDSFRLFSHQKSVLKRFFMFDLKLRYPPYSGKLKPILWLLRWFG